MQTQYSGKESMLLRKNGYTFNGGNSMKIISISPEKRSVLKEYDSLLSDHKQRKWCKHFHMIEIDGLVMQISNIDFNMT